MLWEVDSLTDLLRANLTRLWKNKVFWCSMALMAIAEILMVLNGCRQAKLLAVEGYVRSLDDYYFGVVVLLGLLLALILGLFLGTEYSDGTLRNKLVMGRTRREVYLANLLTGFAAAVLLALALFLAGLVGVPVLGLWEMGVSGALLHFLVVLCSSMALVALYTLVGMISEKKSTTAVAVILLFLALLLLSSWIYAWLNEPPMNSGIIITAEGMSMAPETPNPNYVSGVARRALELILDILPTGQVVLLSSGGIARPGLNLAASAVITLCTTLAGLAFFEGKDLK